MIGETPANIANNTVQDFTGDSQANSFDNIANIAETKRNNNVTLKRVLAGVAAAGAIFSYGCGKTKKTVNVQHKTSPNTQMTETMKQEEADSGINSVTSFLEPNDSFVTETESQLESETESGYVDSKPSEIESRATLISVGLDENGFYSSKSVEAKPGLDYEDFLMDKEEIPAGAPKDYPNGCMDFTAYCGALGVAAEDINCHGSYIIVGDKKNIAVEIGDHGDIFYYVNEKCVCSYDNGKAGGFGQDGLVLCGKDENGEYICGTKMHVNDTNLGVLEIALSNYANGETKLF